MRAAVSVAPPKAPVAPQVPSRRRRARADRSPRGRRPGRAGRRQWSTVSSGSLARSYSAISSRAGTTRSLKGSETTARRSWADCGLNVSARIGTSVAPSPSPSINGPILRPARTAPSWRSSRSVRVGSRSMSETGVSTTRPAGRRPGPRDDQGNQELLFVQATGRAPDTRARPGPRHGRPSAPRSCRPDGRGDPGSRGGRPTCRSAYSHLVAIPLLERLEAQHLVRAKLQLDGGLDRPSVVHPDGCVRARTSVLGAVASTRTRGVHLVSQGPGGHERARRARPASRPTTRERPWLPRGATNGIETDRESAIMSRSTRPSDRTLTFG